MTQTTANIIAQLDLVRSEFAALIGVQKGDVHSRFLLGSQQIHVIAGRVNFLIDVERFPCRYDYYHDVLAKFGKADFRFRRPYLKAAA